MNLGHLSYSAVRTYRRCPRQYYFQYVMGYRAIETPVSLVKGALFHELLALYHGPGEGEIDYSFLANYLPTDTGNDGTYEEEILRVLGTFLGYSSHERGQLPPGKTEVEFDLDLSDDLTIRGVIDYTDGESVVEHKLTGHPDIYTPLSTRLQIGVYLLQTSAIRAIINCVTPPGLKRGKKGSGEPRKIFVGRIQKAFLSEPGRYITRNTYSSREYNLPEIKATYCMIGDDIRRKLNDKNPRMAFWQEDSTCYFPSPCEFLPCCETGADPDEIIGVFKKKDLDSENLG